jgi:hypothetical protein
MFSSKVTHKSLVKISARIKQGAPLKQNLVLRNKMEDELI